MIQVRDCEFLQWRSTECEERFFANMGCFFASAKVRRECGGYPLRDGPRYRWFIVRLQGETRVLGFISVEQTPKSIRIREGYVRNEARQQGLFRALLKHVLEYIDHLEMNCIACVLDASAQRLSLYGFEVQSTRGKWVTLVRTVNAKDRRSAQTSKRNISGIG